MEKIKDAITEYLKYLKKKGRAKSTLMQYKSRLDNFYKHVNEYRGKKARYLKEITPAMMNSYSKSLESKSAQTASDYAIIIRQFLQSDQAVSHLKFDASTISVGKEPRRTESLFYETKDQRALWNTILNMNFSDNLPTRYRQLAMTIAVSISLDTGCRRRELACLTLKSLNQSEDTWTITITNRKDEQRIMPISPSTKALLSEYLIYRLRLEGSIYLVQRIDSHDRIWYSINSPSYGSIASLIKILRSVIPLLEHRPQQSLLRNTCIINKVLDGADNKELLRVADVSGVSLLDHYLSVRKWHFKYLHKKVYESPTGWKRKWRSKALEKRKSQG